MPSAVLVIQNGTTKLVNIKNQDGITKILDMVPDFVNKFTSKMMWFLRTPQRIRPMMPQNQQLERDGGYLKGFRKQIIFKTV